MTMKVPRVGEDGAIGASSVIVVPLAEPKLVVGMVGYPNVGKSSTINVLLGVTAATHGVARVAVGATPGKTKHFQVRNQ